MFDKLKEMITNYVDVDADSIELDSRFAEDLGFNSYDFILTLKSMNRLRAKQKLSVSLLTI